MNAKLWKKAIIRDLEALGTYKEAFDASIDTLADILEQRDEAKKAFLASGEGTTVTHTLDRGAQNQKVNPTFKVWMDLNSQALTYWREMGLTPKSFKSMDEQIDTSGSLEKVLATIGI